MIDDFITERLDVVDEAKIVTPSWMKRSPIATYNKNGYGVKIPTQYMVKSKQLGNRWLRVYACWPCGNEPSLYVVSREKSYFVWDWKIHEKIAA